MVAALPQKLRGLRELCVRLILTNRLVEMSVDLWTMGNVDIHLRHPPSRGALLRTGVHGGQDVKMLPVSVFNACSSKHFSVEHYRAAKIFSSASITSSLFGKVVDSRPQGH